MILEVGKKYKNRIGRIVEITHLNDSITNYPILSKDGRTYMLDGRYHLNDPENINDLIEEVLEKEPIEKCKALESGYDSEMNGRHYVRGGIESIEVIEAWQLGFCLGNVVKYISRAGVKSDNILEDLKKARWYLDREIKTRNKE
jgi:hypothetical protein